MKVYRLIMSYKFSYLSSMVFMLFVTATVKGQMPSLRTDIPMVSPPSPTVAGLMKFEEVPVNNYTGVPDISIPLYSIQSQSPDIVLNLSLNYHPASTAVREVASYTGLGWNLFAGGTISRTVRGLPDEIDNEEGFDSQPQRRGIYSLMNPYYQVNALRSDNNINRYNNQVKKFFWESVEKGWYDTQHDLYQYNFMGYTGRFYIKLINGVYKVEKLDNNNNLEISVDITTTNNAINIDKFTVKDEKGYEYIFDVTEVTTSRASSFSELFVDDNQSGYPLNENTYSYTSAFHLSSIKDNSISHDPLIILSYYANTFRETDKSSLTTTNHLDSTVIQGWSTVFDNSCGSIYYWDKMEPKISTTNLQNTAYTKKLEKIEIPNKAKILFSIISDREDVSSIVNNVITKGIRLESLTISDYSNNNIKRFVFEVGYSTFGDKRMRLEKITERNFQDTLSHSYNLEYTTPYVESSDIIGIDYWGYYNIAPAFFNGIYSETSPTHCKVDVLEKITLPTGGAISYDFESNEYSYDGDIRLENFSANPNRFTEVSKSLVFDKMNGVSDYSSWNRLDLDDEQLVRFTGYGPGDNWTMDLVKAGTSYRVISVPPNQQGNSPSSTFKRGSAILPQGWNYQPAIYSLNYPGPSPGSFTLTAYYKERSDRYYEQALLGGGVRIKSISYFDNLNDVEPVRKKEYNYNCFDDPRRSSGSLVFPKPVLDVLTTRRHGIKKTDICKLFSGDNPKMVNYMTHTSFNNLKALKSQGADVGYKNVTVFETGNGKSQFTYTSPIDVPEIDYESTDVGHILKFPFKSSKNLDYKRGILKNEKHFDEYSRVLLETIYDHTILDGFVQTGINIYAPLGSCKVFDPNYSYTEYMYLVHDVCGGAEVGGNNFNDLCYHCGDPSQYIEYFDIEEYFGWVQLKQKTTKKYFYDSNNKQSTISEKEDYTYNVFNKQLSSYTKTTNSTNGAREVIREDYYYLKNSAVVSQNDICKIQEIQKFRNNELISKQKINYSNGLSVNNYDFLPETIAISRESGSSESVKLRFIKYDVFGSPLEAKRENGISVCYIYDCNHHSPIAVIENATYAEIVSILGSPVNPLGYSEADMIALNGLRDAVPSARVTTYTYFPLVGVSTVTDSRGYTMKYFYDGFGRLKQVKDHEGKIVSESVYRYSTQN